MFKGFQDTSSQNQFKGVPNLNFQQANSAYGFSGVTFWLDAAYGLNTQTDLGAVSSWQSRVGGITFTQPTAANQPRLVLNDANFNNLPTVQSHDNARWMSQESAISFDNNRTIVCVAKTDTVNSVDTIIAANQTMGILASIVNGKSENGVRGFGYYPFTGNGWTDPTRNTITRINILTENNIVVNGANVLTGTTTLNFASMYDIFRYGRNQPGGFQVYNLVGKIAEIIIFANKLSNTDMIALSDRINQKYAIY